MWIIKKTLMEGPLVGQWYWIDARGYLHYSSEVPEPQQCYKHKNRADVAADHYNQYNAQMLEVAPSSNVRCEYQVIEAGENFEHVVDTRQLRV